MKFVIGQHECLIDDDEAWRLDEAKWRILASAKHDLCYVAASGRLLHREIMGAIKGQYVDHINHDGLDNRRENLRIATCSQNLANGRFKSGRSQLRGVHWHKRRQVWVASIRVSGKHLWLGSFISKETAAGVYNSAARHYYGEFATLNPVADVNFMRPKRHHVWGLPTGVKRSHTRSERWEARIRHDGIERHLGTFGTIEEAHAAYLAAVAERAAA